MRWAIIRSAYEYKLRFLRIIGKRLVLVIKKKIWVMHVSIEHCPDEVDDNCDCSLSFSKSEDSMELLEAMWMTGLFYDSCRNIMNLYFLFYLEYIREWTSKDAIARNTDTNTTSKRLKWICITVLYLFFLQFSGATPTFIINWYLTENKKTANIWEKFEHYGTSSGAFDSKNLLVPKVHSPYRWQSRLAIEEQTVRSQSSRDRS